MKSPAVVPVQACNILPDSGRSRMVFLPVLSRRERAAQRLGRQRISAGPESPSSLPLRKSPCKWRIGGEPGSEFRAAAPRPARTCWQRTGKWNRICSRWSGLVSLQYFGTFHQRAFPKRRKNPNKSWARRLILAKYFNTSGASLVCSASI